MKGKLAFVLGAAVGYVLGTRAGRERYEQIKRGAQRIWHTEPVQRGVHLVKDVVDDRADDLKAFAVRIGNDVFSNLAQGREKPGAPPETASAETASAETAPAESAPAESASPETAAAKSAAAKPAAAKRGGSASGAKKPAAGESRAGS